ncbi:MAG TPA: type IX secretion system membrane protein PorP/SprF [Chitinophagales bacterium]|nr:type IX secretion system membrane protein PorP/SprF [Chitinophagales bacterium]
MPDIFGYPFMMKNILIGFIFICSTGASLAQQLPIFSLYHENSFILNPAMTGTEDHGIITATYRDQWNGMDGRPRTVSGTYRSPIPRTNMGVGTHLVNDITGPTSYTGATVTYAYHISFKKIKPFYWAKFLRNSKLSFGIALSAYHYRLKSSELVLENPFDLAVSSDNQSAVRPNAGVGMYYYYDKIYFGFSAPQLLPLTVNFEAADGTSAIQRKNHFYITLGGKIPLGGKVPKGYYNKFYIEPVAWFKYAKGAPLQYDVYARFRHKNIVWAGAGYRSSKTMIFDAGVMLLKQLQLGYAYDLQVNSYRADLGNTHEVIVAFHLPSKQGRSFGVR